MLPRILEPEVMDTPAEARDYDSMDHSAVNRVFVVDFFSAFPNFRNPVLDVGTGTAQIPIQFCLASQTIELVAIDLAYEMLLIARKNVEKAGFANRIQLEKVNGRELPYPDGQFGSVVSNSIIHHIPQPLDCFREMHRVCQRDGAMFVRDLLRPNSMSELNRLVDLHAAGANAHQRMLFANSLHAALTLSEVQEMVAEFGYPPEAVRQTTDRHWTFVATKPMK